MPKQPTEAKETKRITLVFTPGLYNAVRLSAQADLRPIGSQVLVLLNEALEARKAR